MLRDSAGLGFEIQTRLAAVDNYNRWIASRFLPHAGPRLVDAGCALGNITQFFLDRELVIGIDIAADFVAAVERRFADRSNFRALQADVADPALPDLLASERIDSILCANVLEHVEDDAGALAALRSLLVPGGRIVRLPIGAAVEAVTREALLRAAREAREPRDREHVTTWVKRRADLFTVAFPAAPPPLRRPELRVTVDTPADLAYVRALFARTGTAQPSLGALIEAAGEKREVA